MSGEALRAAGDSGKKSAASALPVTNQENQQFPVFLNQSVAVQLGKASSGENSFDPSQIVEKLVP